MYSLEPDFAKSLYLTCFHSMFVDAGNVNTLSHIDDFYPQTTWMHVYTDGSLTYAVQDGGAGSLIYLPKGQTLKAASATGNNCTNYGAKMKALEQGAQVVIEHIPTQKM